MKKELITVPVLLGLVIILFVYSADTKVEGLPNPYVKAYPFKSAIIHYKNTITDAHGKTFEGTMVAYIKGDKTAMVSKMTVPDRTSGKSLEIESIQIFDPEYIYLINVTANVGTKLDNSTKFTKAAYEALSASEKKAFHERLAKSSGIVSMDLPPLGLKEKSEDILGHKCDLYHLSTGFAEGTVDSEYWDEKTCVWGTTGIVLKRIEERQGVLTTQTATKIEENIPIPDSKFVVPKGAKITYDEATSEYRKKGALAAFRSLKTGEPIHFGMKLKGTRMKAKKEESTREKQVIELQK
jgi:hypothetical protein